MRKYKVKKQTRKLISSDLDLVIKRVQKKLQTKEYQKYGRKANKITYLFTSEYLAKRLKK